MIQIFNLINENSIIPRRFPFGLTQHHQELHNIEVRHHSLLEGRHYPCFLYQALVKLKVSAISLCPVAVTPLYVMKFGTSVFLLSPLNYVIVFQYYPFLS